MDSPQLRCRPTGIILLSEHPPVTMTMSSCSQRSKATMKLSERGLHPEKEKSLDRQLTYQPMERQLPLEILVFLITREELIYWYVMI